MIRVFTVLLAVVVATAALAGTPTQYYVDPAIAGNSGAGTTGDPYGDLQHALDTVTRDATNGDQINVKAGTDEVLAAALSLATYGTPTEAAPLIIRGYTSAANDGGVGGISGNATYAIIASTAHIHFIDMHLHNCGSATIVTISTSGSLQNCEIDTTTGIAVDLSTATIIGCNVHTFGTTGIDGNLSFIYGNYVSDASATVGILGGGSSTKIINNIITIGGATDGIQLGFDANIAIGNSILSSGGSGQGIIRTSNRYGAIILNNLVEGFSDTGGVGIDLGSNTENVAAYGLNAVRNCATAYSTGSADFVNDLGDNETLGATPFAKSGSDTFANRFTYFAPEDTGNVRGGAFPTGDNQDKGAVQHADSGGGTTAKTISSTLHAIGSGL